MRIDNFALTLFQSCPAKYFLRIKQGWTTRRKSAALGFGGALHAGLAEWYKHDSEEKATQMIKDVWPDNLPIDDYRTREKCVRTLEEYVRNYRHESFKVIGDAPDNRMVECTFTLSTGRYLNCPDHPDAAQVWKNTGAVCSVCGAALEEIEYGGIFDTLVEFSGAVYVLEHKTTSQLGTYYFDQFKPNNQVTGYVWAARKLSGRDVGGAIVNAIGVYKATPTKFERRITSRSAQEIDDWLVNLQATCQQIDDCEKRGYWPLYTPSCTQYGRCEYHQIHTLGNEVERQALLEQDYVREEWSYETRDEVASNG